MKNLLIVILGIVFFFAALVTVDRFFGLIPKYHFVEDGDGYSRFDLIKGTRCNFDYKHSMWTCSSPEHQTKAFLDKNLK